MGQFDVLKALSELGCPSTIAEVTAHIFENPRDTDIKHIRSYMQSLFKWDEVAFVPQSSPRRWYLTDYGKKCFQDRSEYDITKGW